MIFMGIIRKEEETIFMGIIRKEAENIGRDRI